MNASHHEWQGWKAPLVRTDHGSAPSFISSSLHQENIIAAHGAIESTPRQYLLVSRLHALVNARFHYNEYFWRPGRPPDVPKANAVRLSAALLPDSITTAFLFANTKWCFTSWTRTNILLSIDPSEVLSPSITTVSLPPARSPSPLDATLDHCPIAPARPRSPADTPFQANASLSWHHTSSAFDRIAAPTTLNVATFPNHTCRAAWTGTCQYFSIANNPSLTYSASTFRFSISGHFFPHHSSKGDGRLVIPSCQRDLDRVFGTLWEH